MKTEGIRKFFNDNRNLLALFLLFSLHFVGNYLYIRSGDITIGCDVMHHLNRSVDFYDGLKDVCKSGFSFSSFFSLFEDDQLYSLSKLFYFITALINGIFGLSPIVSKMANMPFFLILIVSTYLIGKEALNKEAGLLSATIVSFYPGLLGISHTYTLEFPNTAMVALGVFFLIKADKFSNLKYSVVFGIVSGLALLTRLSYMVYMLFPFLYTVLYESVHGKNNKALFILRIRNLLLSLLTANAIFLISWRDNGYELFKNIFSTIYAAAGFFPSFQNFTDFAGKSIIQRGLFNIYTLIQYIGPGFFFIFIVGLAIFIKSKCIRCGKLFIFWILPTFFVLIFAKYPRTYYLFPIFAPFAIISACGIATLKYKKIKLFLIVFIALFSFLSFLIFFLPPQKNILHSFVCPSYFLQKAFPNTEHYWCQPLSIDSYYKTLAKEHAKIISENADKGKPVNILVLGDDRVLSSEYAELWRYLLRMNLPHMHARVVTNYIFLPVSFLSSLDFLIVIKKTGEPLNYGKKTSISCYYREKHVLGWGRKEIMHAQLIDDFTILRKDALGDRYRGYAIYLLGKA